MNNKTQQTQTLPKLKAWKCFRCGHGWYSRLERPPKNCPGCKTYAYRTKKRGANGKN